MIGRTVIGQIGQDIQVLADDLPVWMRAGGTLDWSKVTAVGADTTLPDGTLVRAGQKVLRYGQVLAKITNPTVLTVTITGAMTAGSVVYTGTRPDNGAVSSQTIAYNASLAAIQAALDAIYGAGSTLAAGTIASFTITGQNGLLWNTIPPGSVNVAGATGATGGTVTATNAGTNTGWFGPFDPAAADGRQTLTRGGTGVVNRTILQGGVMGTYTVRDPDHFGLLIGGLMYRGRVIQSGVAAASLAAGPTLAALETVLPLARWATH